MKKEALLENVAYLNQIIATTTKENSLSKIVDFFKISSKLQDNLENIKGLGVKRKYLFFEDKTALERRSFFFQEVNKAGRDPYGINRTKAGDVPTKHTIFLGNVDGIWTSSISSFEELKNSSNEYDKDTFAKVCSQAYNFIVSYKKSFNVDFLG